MTDPNSWNLPKCPKGHIYLGLECQTCQHEEIMERLKNVEKMLDEYLDKKCKHHHMINRVDGKWCPECGYFKRDSYD